MLQNHKKYVLFYGLTVLLCFGFKGYENIDTTPKIPVMPTSMQKDSTLRHIVLFKFKETTTKKELKAITDAFGKLPSKIKEIKAFEWGLNNSPEGLDKGFTHCFLVTFGSEADREVYLPHPNHKAFVDLASPFIDDVLVVDYWTD